MPRPRWDRVGEGFHSHDVKVWLVKEENVVVGSSDDDEGNGWVGACISPEVRWADDEPLRRNLKLSRKAF